MIQNTRHKDLIIAWLNGAEIEVFKQATKRWEIVHSPSFIEDYDYRIKSKEVRFSGLRVDYFNIQVYVPHWARWIACDEYGYINVYSEKPSTGRNHWFLPSAPTLSINHECVGVVNPCPQWKETLLEIKVQ